jgi:hypothetical protein
LLAKQMAFAEKSSKCDIGGLVSGLRFRVPILDLNQIKSPRAQPIVQFGQALLRDSRSGD